jgi:hypothetical protein
MYSETYDSRHPYTITIEKCLFKRGSYTILHILTMLLVFSDIAETFIGIALNNQQKNP